MTIVVLHVAVFCAAVVLVFINLIYTDELISHRKWAQALVIAICSLLWSAVFALNFWEIFSRS